MKKPLWRVPRIWEGEVAFIICGGPSVLQEDLSSLRGRRVIAINASFQAFLSADFLYFHDWRFWGHYHTKLKAFTNRIVTTSRTVRNLSFNDKRVHCLEKLKPPPGLAVDISKLAVCHTSLTGAINLAWHLGAAKIVLLGADLKGDDHHHPPHPWKVSQNCYPLMLSDLRLMMEELNRRNFPIVNTSMDSACDFIPKVNLGEACAI